MQVSPWKPLPALTRSSHSWKCFVAAIHFAEFAQFIRQHGLESEDRELILKLKSVLWAVVSVLGCCAYNTLRFTFVNVNREI